MRSFLSTKGKKKNSPGKISGQLFVREPKRNGEKKTAKGRERDFGLGITPGKKESADKALKSALGNSAPPRRRDHKEAVQKAGNL